MIENISPIVMSRQMALRRKMAVVANNLANVNTTAFKRDDTIFESHLIDVENSDRPLNFVLDAGTHRDVRQGPTQLTGNPLDLALNGDGFFMLEGQAGPVYTRNGSFKVSSEGELIHTNGRKVLGDNGEPIAIEPGASNIVISNDGTVTVDNNPAGKLGLAGFANKQELRQVGDGVYVSRNEPEELENPQVIQGSLEGSNVNPILEMTALIEINKSYSSISKISQDESQMRRRILMALARPF